MTHTPPPEMVTVEDLAKELAADVDLVAACLSRARLARPVVTIQGQKIQLVNRAQGKTAFVAHGAEVAKKQKQEKTEAPADANARLAQFQDAVKRTIEQVMTVALREHANVLGQAVMRTLGAAIGDMEGEQRALVTRVRGFEDTLIHFNNTVIAQNNAIMDRLATGAVLDQGVSGVVHEVRDGVEKIHEQNRIVFKQIEKNQAAYQRQVEIAEAGIARYEATVRQLAESLDQQRLELMEFHDRLEPVHADPAQEPAQPIQAPKVEPTCPRVAVFGAKAQVRQQLEREYAGRVLADFYESEDSRSQNVISGLARYDHILLMSQEMNHGIDVIKQRGAGRVQVLRGGVSSLRTAMTDIWAKSAH